MTKLHSNAGVTFGLTDQRIKNMRRKVPTGTSFTSIDEAVRAIKGAPITRTHYVAIDDLVFIAKAKGGVMYVGRLPAPLASLTVLAQNQNGDDMTLQAWTDSILHTEEYEREQAERAKAESKKPRSPVAIKTSRSKIVSHRRNRSR